MTKPITPFDPEYVPQLKVQQAPKPGGGGWKKQPGLVLSRKPHGGAYARAVPTGKR
jgi:hypothetical protein